MDALGFVKEINTVDQIAGNESYMQTRSIILNILIKNMETSA